MSGGASKLRDVTKLSDARAILELDVGLSEMPELPAKLMAGGGPLHVQVEFGHAQGHRVAHVQLVGELRLICQRCLQPMPWTVRTHSPVLLVEAEAQAEGAPADWETYLAVDGRISVAALAGEELLLALPIVPLHADERDCSAAEPQTGGPRTDAEEVSRPFADLRALLERGAKPKA